MKFRRQNNVGVKKYGKICSRTTETVVCYFGSFVIRIVLNLKGNGQAVQVRIVCCILYNGRSPSPRYLKSSVIIIIIIMMTNINMLPTDIWRFHFLIIIVIFKVFFNIM